MSGDLVEKKSFEERMKDRIRDSIGELMTDEELSKIVKKATEEIFFKPTTVKEGYHTREEKPFIFDLVKDLLRDSVHIQVKDYFEENKESILERIDKIIKEGLGSAVLNALASKFDMDLNMFQNNLIQTLQNQ